MTHIVPTLTYGMDVWGPNHGIQGRPASLQPLSDVIDKACRVAMGLHATTGSKAWSKYTSVCKSVLQSDFRLLPPLLQVELAHARLYKRSLPNDKRVFPSGEHVELEDAIASSAYMAPDHLGALQHLTRTSEVATCVHRKQAPTTTLCSMSCGKRTLRHTCVGPRLRHGQLCRSDLDASPICLPPVRRSSLETLTVQHVVQ